MSIIISINKPYSSLDIREIELDNIVIRLNGVEVATLFEALDEELHFGKTREDLLDEIDELKDKILYGGD